MKIGIISSSLKEDSYSRQLTYIAKEYLSEKGFDFEVFDMREYELPFCDAGSAYNSEIVKTLTDKLTYCDRYIVSTPVYNYGINSVLKNLIELMGGVMENKSVGFLCAAGGRSSYMSIMPFANSLMLDFRCWIVPRFVYTTSDGFLDKNTPKNEIKDRVHQLCDTICAFNPPQL